MLFLSRERASVVGQSGPEPGTYTPSQESAPAHTAEEHGCCLCCPWPPRGHCLPCDRKTCLGAYKRRTMPIPSSVTSNMARLEIRARLTMLIAATSITACFCVDTFRRIQHTLDGQYLEVRQVLGVPSPENTLQHLEGQQVIRVPSGGPGEEDML